MNQTRDGCVGMKSWQLLKVQTTTNAKSMEKQTCDVYETASSV